MATNHWILSRGWGDVTNTNTGLTTLADTSTSRGDFIQLESPQKLIITKFKIFSGTGLEIFRVDKVRFLGSNTGGTDWIDIGSGDITLPAYSGTGANYATTATVSNTNAYKYHRLVVRSIDGSGVGDIPVIYQLQLYGTEEDISIPIQIGGGNIDKVANFRVYDKFVGEDQALEIWDAQKDYFGRAKSSMTLQKGRLGLGTTEPEGRLAVLDEPHNLEEFPPRAMTGYKNYFEGHGEFCISHSGHIGDGPILNAFNKKAPVGDFWYSVINSYGGTNNLYNLSAVSPIGINGEWVYMTLPYHVDMKSLQITARNGETNSAPKTAIIFGSSDGGTTWEQVGGWSDKTNANHWLDEGAPSPAFTINSNKHLNAIGFVVTHGQTSYAFTLGEIRFFGTREQGQSVLHDGQLTLTKSLNVPRIGPALDADDTPRRDRLVVEYNTSTNPTFEGAVRDTSGRGNDGVFTTGADYDATEKALTFNGASTSGITVGGATGVGGDKPFSIGLWFNMTSYTSGGANSLVTFGNQTTNAQLLLTIEQSTGLIYGQFFGASVSIPISGGVQLGKWYHFVLSYPGGGHFNMSLYSNGVKGTNTEYGGNVPGLIPQNAAIEIGRYASSGNPGFNGKMSSFKFYDTALTAEEAKTLYDMGRCDEGHHVVNFSKTRVGIGLGDGEAPQAALDVRGDILGGNPAAFSVAYNPTSLSGNQTIIWNLVYHNVGGAYDSSNGLFTAPVSGYYHFTAWGMTSGNTSGVIELQFRKNGLRVQQRPYSQGVNNYGHVSGTIIEYLSMGDTMKVFLTSSTTLYAASAESYNGFSGFYLSS